MTRTKIASASAAIAVALAALILVILPSRHLLGYEFSDKEVIGLSPDEVVTKYGVPYFDSRVDGWTDGSGHTVVAYTGWFGQTYRIRFEGDSAVEVQRSMK